jgi:hypothetical protein
MLLSRLEVVQLYDSILDEEKWNPIGCTPLLAKRKSPGGQIKDLGGTAECLWSSQLDYLVVGDATLFVSYLLASGTQ